MKYLPIQTLRDRRGPGPETLKFITIQGLFRGLGERTEMGFEEPAVFAQHLSIIINTPSLLRGQQVVILTAYV